MLLNAQVSMKDTTITWHTFKYELNDDNTVSWHTDTEYDTVAKTFSGYILENKYLKVTLVPEFGGRIISMIYKPTNKEELYLNPAGVPYGVDQDWFYYKWLMVYGGIFPTLPEPEHGKAWLLPWEFTILKETSDTIRCQMSWKDTVELEGINTGKWQYGKTNLKCDFTITLIKGASALEADVALYNDSSETLNYEYWTCLTLAPGSEPGSPQCTEGTEFIIPASRVKIPSWYPDIASQEQRIPGESGVYTFTELRDWKNWTNDGIAYVWDDSNENYWGVINHDNEEGFIRISDNNITPGIKLWAWGYQQSQNIDPFKNPNETHRPYVELWAGNSNEFFTPAQFPMFSEKKWKEIYVPTIGLSNVTRANDEIISDFKIDSGKTVNLAFIATRPENHFDVSIEITGQNSQVLMAQTITRDPVNGNQINLELPDHTWMNGDSLKYTIRDTDNGSYLTESVLLDTLTTGISGNINTVAKDFHLEQNYPNPFNPETIISYSLPIGDFTTLKVYDVLGREVATLVDEYKTAGRYRVMFNASKHNLTSGVYLYKLTTSSYSDIRKMVLIK